MQSVAFVRAWRDQAREWQGRAPALPPFVDTARIEAALASGDPAVAVVEPPVPPDQYAGALAQVAELLARHRPPAAAQALALAAAVRGSGPTAQAQLVQAALAGHPGALAGWAAQHGAPGDLLAALAPLALQPFMARFAAQVRSACPLYGWRAPYCPVCGREPDVARVDPDNLRFLHCGLCDTEWQTYRLSCAWCDTDDAKQVQILTAAELEPWRVDLCNACGGYIKTLDQRHGGLLALPGVDLFVEDARTLALDLLAQERGYRRGGRAH